jgi:hypothetical protein
MQIFQLHNLTAQRLGGDALHRLGSLTGALPRSALGLPPPRYASSLDAEFVVSPARSSPPPSRASSTAAARPWAARREELVARRARPMRARAGGSSREEIMWGRERPVEMHIRHWWRLAAPPLTSWCCGDAPGSYISPAFSWRRPFIGRLSCSIKEETRAWSRRRG